MSQQINLLPPDRHAVSPLVAALVVWGVVLLALAAAWGFNEFRLSAARESTAAATVELREAKADLQARIDAKAALAAEIETLRPYAASARQIIDMAGKLGSTTGFSGDFARVANATEDGLWLTGVTMANGTVKEVSGHALNNDAVIGFSRRLNATFAGEGVRFTAVELTPHTVGAAGLAPVTSTKFTIR